MEVGENDDKWTTQDMNATKPVRGIAHPVFINKPDEILTIWTVCYVNCCFLAICLRLEIMLKLLSNNQNNDNKYIILTSKIAGT